MASLGRINTKTTVGEEFELKQKYRGDTRSLERIDHEEKEEKKSGGELESASWLLEKSTGNACSRVSRKNAPGAEEMK